MVSLNAGARPGAGTGLLITHADTHLHRRYIQGVDQEPDLVQQPWLTPGHQLAAPGSDGHRGLLVKLKHLPGQPLGGAVADLVDPGFLTRLGTGRQQQAGQQKCQKNLPGRQAEPSNHSHLRSQLQSTVPCLAGKLKAISGCQCENRRYIVKSMKTLHAACQLNVQQAFGEKLKAAGSAVYFWWFGYGFYFSQSPGRP